MRNHVSRTREQEPAIRGLRFSRGPGRPLRAISRVPQLPRVSEATISILIALVSGTCFDTIDSGFPSARNPGDFDSPGGFAVWLACEYPCAHGVARHTGSVVFGRHLDSTPVEARDSQ